MKKNDIEKIAKKLSDLLYASGFPKLKTAEEIESLINEGKLNDLEQFEICSYSWHLSSNKKWDKAEEIAYLITDEDEKGQALAILARRLAQEGLIDRAEKIIFNITDDPKVHGAFHEKLCSYIEIVKGYIKKDNIEKLNDTLIILERGIDKVEYGSVKANLLIEVGYVLDPIYGIDKTIKYWEKAISSISEPIIGKTITKTSDPEDIKTLKFIAFHLANKKKFSTAYNAINLIAREDLRNSYNNKIQEIENIDDVNRA